MDESRRFDPNDRLTRAEFVMELRSWWDEQLRLLSRLERHNAYQKLVKHELNCAVRVLDSTYRVHHLIDLEGLGKLNANVRSSKHLADHHRDSASSTKARS